MIPIRKPVMPVRKPENQPTRIQLNRHFETEKEMESFLDGVHEANGWLDYEIIEEGRNVDR